MEMSNRQSEFNAIGTTWSIQINDLITDAAWHDLLQRLHMRIEIFDETYSRFRSDSILTMMSKEAGVYPMPQDGFELLNYYEQLYKITNGHVTPMIGSTMVEAGYDPSYTFTKKTMHQPPQWDDVLDYDLKHITIKQPVVLDFGAAGKGYLVDILGKIIEESGVESYLINAGGDIRYRTNSAKILEIGLENPNDASEVIGITNLSGSSLCASAGNKRRWADLNHIINPKTLQSPTNIIATWVSADTTLVADGLATALFFTKPDVLADQFTFSYAVLHSDMSLQSASNFPVTLFETA